MADKKKQTKRRQDKGGDVVHGAEDLTDQGCLYCGRDKGLRFHVAKFQPVDCKASALAKLKREAIKAAKLAEEAGL